MQSSDLTDTLGALLRTLDITQVDYSLDGGGDSGETSLEQVIYRNGDIAPVLPEVPVSITNAGSVVTLAELLERVVADAPEMDWVNNEGGHGTVTVRPFEDEEGLFIECDMTYNEEDSDGDFDDEFDEDPDDPDDDPPPASPGALPAGEDVQ